MSALRTATGADTQFLASFPGTPAHEILAAQVQRGQLRIIEHQSAPIGFLKFSVLWETLPFIEVLVIVDQKRRRGSGSAAVRDWEAEMRRSGFELVLTSTQSDESAQSFWRKLGYGDCGILCRPRQPAEIFLSHSLVD